MTSRRIADSVNANSGNTVGKRTTPLSHYCDWDQVGGRTVAALCGTLMKRLAHENEPSCPVCQHILAERDRDAEQSIEGV